MLCMKNAARPEECACISCSLLTVLLRPVHLLMRGTNIATTQGELECTACDQAHPE